MMNDDRQRRHQDSRSAKDADQAEHEAILRGSVVADRGVYDDRVADALDDYEPDAQAASAPWQRADLKIDSAVGEVQEEFERRKSILGASYPFTLDRGLISYSPSRSGFYEFCLAICVAQTITRGDNVRLPRAFERLSALLIAHALGSGAEHLHLGSPRDEGIGSTFHGAMQEAHRRTGEMFWGPAYGLPHEPHDTGDQGVDFIVWKRPPDRRIGSLFVLGQCACGDDWSGKFSDVDLARYRRWFNPLSYVDPIRAFTTPHHLGDGWLVEALPRAGLIFDRARLTILAEELANDATYQASASRLGELTRLVIDRRAA